MNKVALIVDMPNWAFDIEANLLKEKLQDFYNSDEKVCVINMPPRHR